LTPSKIDSLSLSDLPSLPITQKRELRENISDFLADDIHVITCGYTSGTTGARTPVYISAEEMEARILLRQISFKHSQPSNEVGIRFFGLQHGPELGNYWTFTIPVYFDPNVKPTVDSVINELGRSHLLGGHVRYPSSLAISSRPLRYLTGQMLERSIAPSSTSIRRVLNYGFYCSKAFRDFCLIQWKADVFDSYGLYEVYAAAVECELHGPKHFSSVAIPEVLDPATKTPIENGEGILTWTPLYPFQAAVPILRYWTNDLVRIETGSCRCGYVGPSIESILGRADYSFDFSAQIRDPTVPRVIGICDIIDEIEATTPLVSSRTETQPRGYGDLAPRFTVMRPDVTESEPVTIIISLEKFFDKTGSEMKNVGAKITNDLESKYERLSKKLGNPIYFDVKIVDRMTIQDPIMKA